MANNDDINSLFVAGYEKGREDGIRQTITLMKILFEIYPLGGEFDPSAALLPKPFAMDIQAAVWSFGEKQYKEGEKYQRKLAKGKAEKKEAAA